MLITQRFFVVHTYESDRLSGIQRIITQFWDDSSSLRATIMAEHLRKLLAE
jgi:hypothetical protein